jgi:polysaccharide pyruvyl transferase WcaK-like protein
VIYESVGFYTNTAPLQRWLLQLSMLLARRVSVRDASSWRMTAPVRRFRTVELVDDPALALRPVSRADALALLDAEGVPFGMDAPVVGLSVKRLIADPTESKALTAALVETGRWLVAQGYALLFIPFCHDRARWSEQDVVYAESLIEAIGTPERCHAVQGYYLPAQMAGIVGLCDLVIGMRFHAQVFAHALGVPLVPIGYEEKRTDFISRYNYQAVPIDGITGDALIAALQREEASAHLAASA